MKLHYYPETDSLYIELNPRPGADARIVADGVVADFDAEGNIVGIDIDHEARSGGSGDRSFASFNCQNVLSHAATNPARFAF